VGVATSVDSKPPPISAAFWRPVEARLLNASANIVQMTDGALECRQHTPVGVVAKYWVNHEEKEWTRPIYGGILADVCTKERREGLAGTQTLDPLWGKLEECIPRNGSARTPEQRELLDMYIRAGQWRRMLGVADTWSEWCKAAQGHAVQRIGEVVVSPRKDVLPEAVMDLDTIMDDLLPGELARLERLVRGNVPK
jgi:hypothetical protein